MKRENKLNWSSYGRTHVGKVRTINQDAFADLPDKGLWVVADGMGGHSEGEVASELIVSTFKQFEAEKIEGITTTIHQQLAEINTTLVKKAALLGENEIVGSTVVVLYAYQKRCVVIWSGDSRIYLFRGGHLKQLTQDHNNEAELLADGFSPEEVNSHPYAQILTHAIGGDEEVYIDELVQEVKSDDVFLLCSDGLNKEVSDSKIEEVLTQMPYQQAVDVLMELSLENGGRDNITIVVAQAKGK
jgi:serine/threonine protein phosphatase PrpC